MSCKFYCNKDCEYFPCHKGANEEEFNCLFCYCPLFALGDKCGGNFKFNKHGLKDCSGCTIPHDPKNYDRIVERCSKVMKIAQKGRVNKVRRIIYGAVWAVIALAACLVLPVIAIQNLWRIAELIGMPDITPVLMQLKDAAFMPGWLPAVVCAAVVFGIVWLMHRHKIIGGLLAIVIILVGIIFSLAFTYANGVPMHVVAQILAEYVALGAF